MDVGTHLREARDREHLTLSQVAYRTRIPTPVLERIEDNAFDRLPGGVFIKGHLRAYAAAVGLEPDEIVREYLLQCPAATQELPIVRAPAVEDHHDGRRLAAALSGAAAMLFAYSSVRNLSTPLGIATVELRDEPAPEPTADRKEDAQRLPMVAGVKDGVHLEMQPMDECWVSVVADGELVIYRLLRKGERATVGASSELVVRIGNPAAFVYTLNGRAGRLLGEAGTPITVTITDQNYHTFLREPEPGPRLAETTAA